MIQMMPVTLQYATQIMLQITVLKALKGIINLHKSSSFVNGSSASSASNIGAIVDGTWDAGALRILLGDNYACT